MSGQDADLLDCTNVDDYAVVNVCWGLDCDWQTNDWSTCSAKCGQGTRVRDVWCAGGNFSNCVYEEMPPKEEECEVYETCSLTIGEWSAAPVAVASLGRAALSPPQLASGLSKRG